MYTLYYTALAIFTNNTQKGAITRVPRASRLHSMINLGPDWRQRRDGSERAVRARPLRTPLARSRCCQISPHNNTITIRKHVAPFSFWLSPRFLEEYKEERRRFSFRLKTGWPAKRSIERRKQDVTYFPRSPSASHSRAHVRGKCEVWQVSQTSYGHEWNIYLKQCRLIDFFISKTIYTVLKKIFKHVLLYRPGK